MKALTGSARGDGGIPQAQLLADFAEALVERDTDNIAAHRDDILETLGEAAFIDTAAVAASFHGFVRLADSTGANVEAAGGGNITMEFRDEVGVNDFYKVVNG